MDFMDNESLSDGVVYDETMIGADAGGGGGGSTESDSSAVATESVAIAENASLIYDTGNGRVNLYGKSSGSDRNKHRNTWNPANRTVNTNYTSFGFNKVREYQTLIVFPSTPLGILNSESFSKVFYS